MAEFSFPEAYSAGNKIGRLLLDGHVDEAKSGYDTLMQRIQGETQDEAVRALKKDWVENGMEQSNSIDVKGPNNGMARGHYVYWNPEVVTNEVNNRIIDFCKSHSGCLSLATGSNPQDRLEASKFVATNLNKYLDTALPDPLEKWVFIEDFNRRRVRTDFTAFRDESFSAQIYVPYGVYRTPSDLLSR